MHSGGATADIAHELDPDDAKVMRITWIRGRGRAGASTSHETAEARTGTGVCARERCGQFGRKRANARGVGRDLRELDRRKAAAAVVFNKDGEGLGASERWRTGRKPPLPGARRKVRWERSCRS